MSVDDFLEDYEDLVDEAVEQAYHLSEVSHYSSVFNSLTQKLKNHKIQIYPYGSRRYFGANLSSDLDIFVDNLDHNKCELRKIKIKLSIKF